MSRHILSFSVAWIAVACALNSGSGFCQAGNMPRTPPRPSVRLLIEEAVVHSRDQSSRPVRFMCDSYDKDMKRVTQLTTWNEREVAKKYERTLVRNDIATLFRHDQWYDLAFAASRTKEGSQRTSTLTVRPMKHSGGQPGGPFVDVRAVRTSLAKLANAVSDATDEIHNVVPELRTRKVTALLDGINAKSFRQAVVSLFPDSTWVKSLRTWVLQEKSSAALIRSLAKQNYEDGYNTESARTRDALAQEVVGSLDPKQLAELGTSGELSVKLTSLGDGVQPLFTQYGSMFLETVNRSGGSGSMFADFSRTGDLGVDIFRLPNGTLKFEYFGKTSDGTRVVWP